MMLDLTLLNSLNPVDVAEAFKRAQARWGNILTRGKVTLPTTLTNENVYSTLLEFFMGSGKDTTAGARKVVVAEELFNLKLHGENSRKTAIDDIKMALMVKNKYPKIDFLPEESALMTAANIKNAKGEVDSALIKSIINVSHKDNKEVFAHSLFNEKLGIAVNLILKSEKNDNARIEDIFYAMVVAINQNNNLNFQYAVSIAMSVSLDQSKNLYQGLRDRINSVKGESLLHLAAEKGNEDLIDSLLKIGVDPNKKDENKNSFLYQLMLSGNESLFKKILNEIAFDKESIGMILLHALKENLNIVDAIIEKAKKDNLFLGNNILNQWHFDKNMYCFHILMDKFKQADSKEGEKINFLVKKLLDLGADPNIQNSYGETLLTLAIKRDIKLAEEILNHPSHTFSNKSLEGALTAANNQKQEDFVEKIKMKMKNTDNVPLHRNFVGMNNKQRAEAENASQKKNIPKLK